MEPTTAEQPSKLKFGFESQMTVVEISDQASSQDSRATSRRGESSQSNDTEKGVITTLPPKRYGRVIRHIRHDILNVYRRLFSLVFLFNMIGLLVLLSRNSQWRTSPPLADFATAGSANIMVALLIRQDYIVNTMFRSSWLVPFSAPLRLRCMLAKVYEHGGVHSGCAISAVVWMCLLTGFITQQFVVGKLIEGAGVVAFAYILLFILSTLSITAYPALRFKSHNTFENVHRWGGWFALALFWVELVLFAHSQSKTDSTSLATALFKQPAVYFLFISSLHAILPWLRFHKMHVRPEKLSDHAIRLHFDEPIKCFVGIRISHSPLKEWHAFAAIPSRDGGKSGGSLLISNAGDWTKDTIENPRPYYWVKGVPTTGVLCVAQMFRSVVIVTTGSGIGPCLGVMQDIPNTRVRLIWSTPSPLATFGKEIMDLVMAADPNALIWDTRKQGRPDLVQLAYDMYREAGAESVCVISNPKLTRKVVYGMESRGVPGFGPIWDS